MQSRYFHHALTPLVRGKETQHGLQSFRDPVCTVEVRQAGAPIRGIPEADDVTGRG